jgi:hypothetical protein
LRKFAALFAAAAICLGGMALLALAGILSALLTEPFYAFALAFVPLGGAAALFALWLAGKVPGWFFPGHADLKFWTRVAQGASLALSVIWGWGIYNLLTSPLHWQ